MQAGFGTALGHDARNRCPGATWRRRVRAAAAAGRKRGRRRHQVADRIVKAIGAPMHHRGPADRDRRFSVGIAVGPGDGIETDTLVKNADLALYKAKSEGRSTYHFFEAGMDAATSSSAARSRRACAWPCSATSYAWCSSRCWALRRTGSPASRPCCAGTTRTRTISPVEFIPIAEETGLIVSHRRMGAARGAARPPRPGHADVRVAVNLSPMQFKHKRPRSPPSNRRCAEARHCRRRGWSSRSPSRCCSRTTTTLKDAARAARPGRPHLDGRFRHRLFVAQLPAQLPLRQDQDRPLLHARSEVEGRQSPSSRR
jgi:hypothetical protein